MHLISQAQIERKSRTQLKVVLNEHAILLIGDVESRANITYESDSTRRQAEKEIGEAVETGSVVDGSTRSVSIESKSINRLVAHEVASCLD